MKKKPPLFNRLAICVILGFTWLMACNDISTPPPINPCLNRKPLSANFKVEEDFGFVVPDWKYYSTDTVARTILIFTAEDSLAKKFEWRIGDGVYTKRSFTLNFPSGFLNSNEQVNVTLTVYKKTDATCFPNDDSVKTLTKKIYFTNYCTGLYKGSFYGYLIEDTTRKFSITIDPCYYYHSDPNAPLASALVLRIDNFPHNCADSSFIVSYYTLTTYRKFSFGADGCYFPGGTGYILKDNKTLIVDYTSYTCAKAIYLPTDPCSQRINHRFIGTRVN